MDSENQTPSQPSPASEQPSQNPAGSVPQSMPTGSQSINPAPGAARAAQAVDSVGLPEVLRPQNPQQEQKENEGSTFSTIASGFMGIFGAIFSWIIFPVAVVLILHNFVFQAYHVLGTSMLPTLHNTDYLIVSKLGYTEAAIGRALGKNDLYIPARGQIIVFHYPEDPTKIFVKRVVGLPGDHLVIKNGTVTIYNKKHPNGFNPDVGYEPAGTHTLIDTDVTVQPGEVFVLGDNRTPGGSFDSREWGQLPSSYIIGNAVLRLLPLDQVRIL